MKLNVTRLIYIFGCILNMPFSFQVWDPENDKLFCYSKCLFSRIRHKFHHNFNFHFVSRIWFIWRISLIFERNFSFPLNFQIINLVFYALMKLSLQNYNVIVYLSMKKTLPILKKFCSPLLYHSHCLWKWKIVNVHPNWWVLSNRKVSHCYDLTQSSMYY